MKRQIDYAYKSYVMREHSDLIKQHRLSRLYDYYTNHKQIDSIGVVSCPPFVLSANGVSKSVIELGMECAESGLTREFQECKRINHAWDSRVMRLRKRINAMLLRGSCVFLTLTFNNHTLNTTTPKERRIFVSRFLKSCECMYVANIDFGGERNREHYHAIACVDKVCLNGWRKYGNINVERIRNKSIHNDTSRLAKYVSKLSNHAIKETTQRSALIYSR